MFLKKYLLLCSSHSSRRLETLYFLTNANLLYFKFKFNNITLQSINNKSKHPTRMFFKQYYPYIYVIYNNTKRDTIYILIQCVSPISMFFLVMNAVSTTARDTRMVFLHQVRQLFRDHDDSCIDVPANNTRHDTGVSYS